MANLTALYKRYSADLGRFDPKLKGAFGCPLCLKIPTTAGVPLRDAVGAEHVVPQSLGGQIVTLTCRPCNNTGGAHLESHLVQRVLIEARKRPLVGRMDIGGATQGIEFFPPESATDVIQITGIRKQSDPRQTVRAQENLRNLQDVKLHLSAGYVPLRTAVAVVRAAYLLMFRTFGYRYVFDSSADIVRRQIQQPTVETSVLNGLMWRVDRPSDDETQVSIATAPEESRCFLVMLRLHDQPRHVAAVALPPPGVDGVAFYDRLKTGTQIVDLWSLPLAKGFFPFGDAWRAAIQRSTEAVASGRAESAP